MQGGDGWAFVSGVKTTLSQQSIKWSLFLSVACQCAILSAYGSHRAMHISWGLKQDLHPACFISILIPLQIRRLYLSLRSA